MIRLNFTKGGLGLLKIEFEEGQEEAGGGRTNIEGLRRGLRRGEPQGGLEKGLEGGLEKGLSSL